MGVRTNPILLAPVLERGFHPVGLMSWALFCQAYMLEDEKNKQHSDSLRKRMVGESHVSLDLLLWFI